MNGTQAGYIWGLWAMVVLAPIIALVLFLRSDFAYGLIMLGIAAFSLASVLLIPRARKSSGRNL